MFLGMANRFQTNLRDRDRVSTLYEGTSRRHEVVTGLQVLSNEDLLRRKEYIKMVYGARKNKAEIEFITWLSKKGTVKSCASLWILSFLAAFVTLTTFHEDVFDYFQEVRCKVPELEANFSYTEILLLSAPRRTNYGQHCTYLERDYNGLARKYNFSFIKMYRNIKRSRETPKEISCGMENIIRKNNSYGLLVNYTVFDQFGILCGPTILKRAVRLSHSFGTLVFGVTLGVLGDLKGRLVVFYISTVIALLGDLLVFVPNIYIVVIGRFLRGINIILFYSVFIVFIEMCNVKTRGLTGFLVYEGEAFGFGVRFILEHCISDYRYMIAFHTILLILLFLICLRFFKESPRWLYFRGYRKAAWRGLGYNVDIADNPDKYTIYLDVSILKKLMFSIRMIQTTTMMIFSSTYSYYDLGYGRMKLEFLDQAMTSGAAGAIFYFIIHFFTITTKAKVFIIAFYFTLSFILASIIFMNPEYDMQFSFHMLLLFHSLLIQTIFHYILFQTAELYPNLHRFTAFGFALSSHALGQIIVFMNYHFHIHHTSMLYAPLFLFTGLGMVVAHFLHETGGYDFPDTPREALSAKLYMNPTVVD